MASADGNCNEIPPVSQIYFAELSVGEKTGIGIATAVCIAVIVMFIEQAYFIIRKYETGRDTELRIRSLWLVGIYPMFALAALLAVYVPRAGLLSDLASSIYLAVCLFHFTTLIILYAGGVDNLLHRVGNTGFSLRTPPCCCCCFCCPTIKATLPNLRKLRVMVFQTSFLQPFISFITLILWLDEKYVKGKIAVDEAYLYLAVVNAVSTLTAMYGLIVLYRTSRVFLKKQSITQKFVVLQLVLVIHNLQGFIFVALAKFHLPPCSGRLSSSVRLNAIQHMMVVGEMLVLALLARCLYHKPHAAFQLDKMDKEDKADKEGSSPGDSPNGVAAATGGGGAGTEEVVILSNDLAHPVGQGRYRSLSSSATETWADSGTDNRGFSSTD